MDWLSGIIIAVVVAALAPVATFITSSWIEQGKRKRAYDRLVGETLVFKGAKITRIELTGHYEPLMTDCFVSDIDVGRVEVKSWDGKEVMSFTGREFENLHLVMEQRKDR